MISKTAHFRVKPASLPACEKIISKFIASVKENEPGTLFYISLQQQADPTTFLHTFAFKDNAAELVHRQSDYVQEFVDALYPHLAGNGVQFVNQLTVASTIS